MEVSGGGGGVSPGGQWVLGSQQHEFVIGYQKVGKRGATSQLMVMSASPCLSPIQTDAGIPLILRIPMPSH